LNRFFPAHVEDAAVLVGKTRGNLQEECRLSHTGLPTDEHEGTRDDTASKDPVELGVAQRPAPLLQGLGLGDRNRTHRRRFPPLVRRRSRGRDLFDEGVPSFARRAAPQPLHADLAALLADVPGPAPTRAQAASTPRENWSCAAGSIITSEQRA